MEPTKLLIVKIKKHTSVLIGDHCRTANKSKPERRTIGIKVESSRPSLKAAQQLHVHVGVLETTSFMNQLTSFL